MTPYKGVYGLGLEDLELAFRASGFRALGLKSPLSR